METIKLSIISPVYKAENIVDELVKRIVEEVEKITTDYEIILVEDGGGDSSWDKIVENARRNSKVKGIKLSRNFGQHYAITAGLDKSMGDYIVMMDCDLQDNPSTINDLIIKLKSDYDVVFTKRIKRNHSMFKSLSAKLYNWLIKLLADKNFDVNAGSMIAISKKAKNAFLKLQEKDRLYIQLFKWIGFSNTFVYAEHNPRFEGKSSYSFAKMLSLAIQGLTSHSNKLLKLSIYFGFLVALISLLTGLIVVIFYFIQGFSPGWPSLFIAISFSTGLILISNGILGLYLGKTFEQVKNRPLYLIDKEI